MITYIDFKSTFSVKDAQLVIAEMQAQIDEVLARRRIKKADGKRKLKEKKAKKSKR